MITRKTKTKHNHYRQGDVMVESVPNLPAHLKPISPKSGRVILAYGEKTGHNHALSSDYCSLFQSETESGVTYLEVREATAALEHQEHATIQLEPGVYRVSLQREYSPESIRRVAD